MLTINSIFHLIIDAICAYSIFGFYGVDNLNAYIIYNLCAFTLQMPFGAVLDLVTYKLKKASDHTAKRFYWLVTALGAVVTLVGMYSGPIALGVGNALFHIGGGVNTIKEDENRRMKGAGMGIFVAPGAIGLFLGRTLSEFTTLTVEIRNVMICICALLILAGFLRLQYEIRHCNFIKVESCRPDEIIPGVTKKHITSKKREASKLPSAKGHAILAVLVAVIGCFVVVALRSYIGLEVTFPWKKGFVLPLIATLAVAGGKALGGIFAAKFGELKTILLSLGLAIFCFAFSKYAVFGILALLLFNMTMPVTLYILIKRLPLFSGLSFGLLTVGLFIGYFLHLTIPAQAIQDNILGVVGSGLSLVILGLTVFFGDKLDGKPDPFNR